MASFKHQKALQDAPNMDLSEILTKLQLENKEASDSTSPQPCIPVSKALSQIQHLFQAATSPKAQESILKDIRSFLSAADVHWLFSPCCQNAGLNVGDIWKEFVNSLIQHTTLPKCELDSGELPESSYQLIPDRAKNVTEVLLILLSKAAAEKHLNPCNNTVVPETSPASTLLPSVFIFAATHLQEYLWTTASSRSAANKLMNLLMETAYCKNVHELLCGRQDGGTTGIFGAVLELQRPELKKETWKLNQATKHVFLWSLLQVPRPWLCVHLEHVFPASLIISDDYRTENKVLGVRCLHHIIMNVPAADLRQYNRAQVLYHALFNHLYTSDADLIQVVLPCMLDLLHVLENPSQRAGDPRKPNQYDEVLRLILMHMEMEHKIKLRRVYARSLPPFIERLGILIARHLKRLERVIVGFLEVCDAPEEEARLYVLKSLESTIRHAWPRIAPRLHVLVKSLVRLLYDLSTECSSTPQTVKDELLEHVTRCLLLLSELCAQDLQAVLGDIHSSCSDARVSQCLEKVLQSMRCLQ
ncbi:TELO2-interacting protein 2 isoform X1 [Erpetoichthys calabaricus]|uniref:TELO2-interacting protein 2 isoform X1 n=2 Tax=Erpetoichthys calabaricus TaxID=27687 RepID=UPI0022343F56|nr:TELO2-interacting protein 2 isoform X1 [Erpetoichthys calabaricus]